MINDPTALQSQAREDFNRAKNRANLSTLLNRFASERRELLSFDDVRELIGPRGESYKGMQVVPISLIVGSEGRYRDFTGAFLPKRESSRHRWESIDRAHLNYENLPAIQLFEIGGVYFVRDGNHRVSVARTQGVDQIDAEVVSLASAIPLVPGMSRAELKHSVIDYEKRNVTKKIDFGPNIDLDEIEFTATGRFAELVKHIEVHKYFINQDKEEEISFVEAAESWYRNLYKPIIDLISLGKLARKFPGRTKADLYMWMIRHWDEMKRVHGDTYPLEHAVIDYSTRFGDDIWRRVRSMFRRKRQT